MSDNGEKKEEDYNLYTEDIVAKPWVKHQRLFKLLEVVIGGVVFGVCACVTFALLYPKLAVRLDAGTDSTKRTDIVITRDEYPTDEYISGTKQNETEDQQYREGDTVELDPSNVASQNVMDNIARSIVKVKGSRTAQDYDYFQEESSTSGVMFAYVDGEYMLLTAYSEVYDAGDISVEFSDGTVANGEFVKGDYELGLAVVSVKQSEFQEGSRPNIYITELGNSYQVHQGDDVMVYGRVLGTDYAFNSGLLTRVGVNESHTDSYVGLLYTSMGMHSGDYGFLFDSKGSLIGVPVNSTKNESMVFYGISDVKRVIEALVNDVSIAYCGIIGETVTGTLASRYVLPLGVYVTSVVENSPAFAAGIQAGDVITAVNDESILTFNSFSETIYRLGSGQKVTIGVKRRGRDGYNDVSFTVTLSSKD